MSFILDPHRFAVDVGFDPLSIAWHAAFWAEDPNWTNPGDGNAVAQWDDGSGNGRHATQGTAANRPLFRASVSSLNNRPALEFDGSNDSLQTAAFTTISGASEHFMVADMDSVVTGALFDGINGTNQRRLAYLNTNRYQLYQGGSALQTGAGAGTPNPHAFRVVFDATDELFVDGGSALSGNAGTQNLTGVTIANAQAGTLPWPGHIAFLAVKNGLLTAQERTDLLAWSQSHYGTP